jgi:hypothetical protein
LIFDIVEAVPSRSQGQALGCLHVWTQWFVDHGGLKALDPDDVSFSSMRKHIVQEDGMQVLAAAEPGLSCDEVCAAKVIEIMY